MPERKQTAAEVAERYRDIHRRALLRNPKDELDPVISEGGGLVNRFVDYAHHLGFRKALEQLARKIGPLEGRQVLDLGCGRGRWVKEYASRGAHVTGVDVSPEAIEVLSREMPQHNFLCQDLSRLAVPEKHFDVINSVTVLQHLPEDAQLVALGRVREALKPGGHLVLLENLVDHEPDVFAHDLREWIGLVEATGLRVVWSAGSNYEVLLRIVRRLRKPISKPAGVPSLAIATRNRPTFKHRPGNLLRLAVAYPSFPLEWALDKVPLVRPTHGVMIFRGR